jgi:hypothetical protein
MLFSNGCIPGRVGKARHLVWSNHFRRPFPDEPKDIFLVEAISPTQLEIY